MALARFFYGSRPRSFRNERAGAPELAGKVVVPDVLVRVHSAPLNLGFYDGDVWGRPVGGTGAQDGSLACQLHSLGIRPECE